MHFVANRAFSALHQTCTYNAHKQSNQQYISKHNINDMECPLSLITHKLDNIMSNDAANYIFRRHKSGQFLTIFIDTFFTYCNFNVLIVYL